NATAREGGSGCSRKEGRPTHGEFGNAHIRRQTCIDRRPTLSLVRRTIDATANCGFACSGKDVRSDNGELRNRQTWPHARIHRRPTTSAVVRAKGAAIGEARHPRKNVRPDGPERLNGLADHTRFDCGPILSLVSRAKGAANRPRKEICPHCG